VSEVNKQKITLKTVAQAAQVQNDDEDHIRSLAEHLLKIKVWAVRGEDITYDCNLELEMKSGSENSAHLHNQSQGALEKLMYALKLNAFKKNLKQRKNLNI
jgi:hypothetical protein